MRILTTLLLFFCAVFGQLLGEPSLALTPEEVQTRLGLHIHLSSDGPNKVGYLQIDREKGIDNATWFYVKTALDRYREIKPAFIILELNTPGGEVGAAENISRALVNIDINDGIPVVAVIDNWAMSAGALLAYSCRFIATTIDASMGAAEVVYQGEGGRLETASQKMISAFRTDFANRAQFFGRNPLLAEAMVDADLVLVIRDGRIVQLQSYDQLLTSDVVVTAKGKPLTLSGEQLIRYGVSDLQIPPVRLEPLTAAEREAGHWPASKYALFQVPFFASIPQAEIYPSEMSWKTTFFSFLSMPLISSLLLLGLIIGFYMEMSTPGFGVPGLIALVCLGLILLSSFAIEAAGWLEVILLLVGVVLIALEVFVLPGFGIPGVLGILLTLAGLAGLMLPNVAGADFQFESGHLAAAAEYFLARAVWFCGTLIVALLIIWMLARYLMPKFSGFRRLVHVGEQETDKGYISGLTKDQLPAVGSEGDALTMLRPGGKVIIAGEVYDALSDSRLIHAGATIIVVRVEGNRLFVDETGEPKES